MENRENIFEYTYSAPSRDEVKKIRAKYLPKAESKLERLRRLDKCVTQKGISCSLSLGVASSLVLGIGVCCTMLGHKISLIPGIIICSIGIIGITLAFPLYSYITQKERERVAPEILQLTNELMYGKS